MSTKSATTMNERQARAIRVGTVTSDAPNKTITVMTAYSVKHPKYGKYMGRRSKVHAHDEQNQAHVGDTVEIMECRPISKTKHWRLVRIINKANTTH